MALIHINDLCVTARFKETQLTRIRREEAVTIHVDAIGRDFSGHIQSIFEETGTLYGLLPGENATGNYVKVVRIAFNPGQDFSLLGQLFG
jgi:membrane fusion protein, multidrug efflux system